MVTKATPFELLSDQQGRYLFVHARVGRMPILFVTSPPPPYCSEVVTTGLAFMARHLTVPAVWMGDFNMTMDPPAQTRGNTRGSRLTRLGHLMKEFALADVWRQRNPTTRAYTCHSTSHATMSRIDNIMVSASLMPRVGGAGFAPRALSDHSP